MRKLFCAVCTMLLAVSYVQADTVASFNFTDGSLAATTQDIGTSGDIVLGADYSIDAANGTFFNTNTGFGTATGAADQQALFTYTVSGLAADERLTLDNITLNVIETGGANSYRIQGYAAGQTASGNEDPPVTDIVVLPFTLNTSNYTNLENGAMLSVGFGARDGNNPPTRVDYDNLVLNGTITTVASIPEPSSACLLGLGAIALFTQRRKRI